MCDAPPRSDSPPSRAECLVFGLVMGLFAMLIKTTFRASLNEGFPVTITLFAVFLWLLGVSRHAARWRAATCFALLVISPLLWTSRPHASAFTEIVDLACQSPRWPERLTDVMLFPVVSMAAGVGGVFAGAGSAVLLGSTRWAPAMLAVRWLATTLALAALVLMIVKTRGLPDPETYLARLPVVATLFPAAEPFTEPARGSDRPGSFPQITVEGIRVERTCATAEARSCTLTLHTDESREPTYEGVGCLDGRERTVLRRGAALERWIVETDRHIVAFRRDGAAPAGVRAVEITTLDLLPVATLPRGWFFTVLLGIVLALRAAWQRRRTVAADAAQLAAWDLFGAAAVALSLITIAPWLHAIFG